MKSNLFSLFVAGELKSVDILKKSGHLIFPAYSLLISPKWYWWEQTKGYLEN